MVYQIISILLALIPAILWAAYFMKRRDHNFKTYFGVFLFGCITAIVILGYQVAYVKITDIEPSLNFTRYLYNLINPLANYSWFAFTIIWFASSEEIIKFLITYIVDKRNPELIITMGDSLKFGILAGLAFAFGENIVYYARGYNNTSGDHKFVFNLFVQRSLLTVCGHLVWSGIIAYFYGVSKFAKDILSFKKWTGHTLAVNAYQKFKRNRIIFGVTLACILHTGFNILVNIKLDKNLNMVLAIASIFIGFIYLNVLLEQKIGNLKFKLADRYKGLLDQSSIDVIYEYMGDQFKAAKYENVCKIAKRLLSREPDNNVAQIFLAKANDKLQK